MAASSTTKRVREPVRLCTAANCNHPESFHPRKDPEDKASRRGQCRVMGCHCGAWKPPAKVKKAA